MLLLSRETAGEMLGDAGEEAGFMSSMAVPAFGGKVCGQEWAWSASSAQVKTLGGGGGSNKGEP